MATGRDGAAARRPVPAAASRAGSSTSSATRTSATAIRVFRLDRIQGKVAYATKAEHDFQRPEDFDPRGYANQVPWQLGDPLGDGRDLGVRPHRLDGRAPLLRLRRARARRRRRQHLPLQLRASPRLLIAWALGFGEHARILGPPELVEEARERLDRVVELHRGEPRRSDRRRRRAPAPPTASTAPEGEPRAARPRARRGRDPPRALRPPGHARVGAHPRRPREPPPPGRRGARRSCRCPSRSCARTSTSSTSSTSAAAPTCSTPRSSPTARSRSTPSRTRTPSTARRACCRSRPRRSSPRSTCSATTCPPGSLASAREKIVAALGEDPVREGLQVTTAGGDDSGDRARRRIGDRGPPGARARVLRRRARTASRAARSSRTR